MVQQHLRLGRLQRLACMLAIAASITVGAHTFTYSAAGTTSAAQPLRQHAQVRPALPAGATAVSPRASAWAYAACVLLMGACAGRSARKAGGRVRVVACQAAQGAWVPPAEVVSKATAVPEKVLSAAAIPTAVIPAAAAPAAALPAELFTTVVVPEQAVPTIVRSPGRAAFVGGARRGSSRRHSGRSARAKAARRATGARLLASQPPAALQRSYDISKVRSKLQRAMQQPWRTCSRRGAMECRVPVSCRGLDPVSFLSIALEILRRQ